MTQLDPVDVLDLFAGERAVLVDLLGLLSNDEWAAPTACAGWSIKDVALHLLGDDVGRLSGGRDGFTNPSFGGPDLDLNTWSDLITAINRQNDAWVAGTRRMSPRLLIDLLRLTGEQTADYFRSLDLSAMGMPVNWAGSEPAPVWLDVAREYTERWVHQQHIRDAVERPGLKERRWFGPVLETFVHGLRRALHDFAAPEGKTPPGGDGPLPQGGGESERGKWTAGPEGASVRLVIEGDAGGSWTARRSGSAWTLGRDDLATTTTVTMGQETAWRLFTKGITKEEARGQTRVSGDPALADRVLDTVSILA